MNAVTKERILITVRTYPSPSSRYIELVCTGGITDRGEWRRLFPIPLRYLEDSQQYRTYNVINVEVSKGKDGRPETRTPNNTSIAIVDKLRTWEARCEWINPTVFPSLQALIDKGRTIGPVAVREVIDFIAEKDDPEWSPVQKEKLRQEQLFDEQKPLEKIPYKFRFIWKDHDGIEHKSRIIEWEMCQTWRRYRKKYTDPIERIRDKWLGDICGPKRSVSFYMGNLADRRRIFAICGIFCPPKEVGDSETLWSVGRGT